MKKSDVKQAEQAAMANAVRRHKKSGASVKNLLNTRTKSDPQAAMFEKGDELFVMDDDQYLFLDDFGQNGAAGCVVASKTAGKTKTLYFSALNRSVTEYNEDLTPTGRRVEIKTTAAHDVYDAVNACATDGDIWSTIKGKGIKVIDTMTVRVARYNAAGQVIGTRERTFPVFKFDE